MRSSPDSQVYRGVLLGLGSIARSAHMPAFLHAPNVSDRLQIVGIVDDAPAAPASFHGIPLLSSPDQLHTLGAIDFVDICTPTSSHLTLSLWALLQGYHVLCEKPVAVTRAEAVALATAARRADRVVMPCHQYRFNPVWRRVKRWLDEGVIGRWYLAEFRVYRLAADQGASSDAVPWRGRRAGGRGGVLLDHGTHLVYELLDVAGPPQAVRDRNPLHRRAGQHHLERWHAHARARRERTRGVVRSQRRAGQGVVCDVVCRPVLRFCEGTRFG